jgi:hypothetical protein
MPLALDIAALCGAFAGLGLLLEAVELLTTFRRRHRRSPLLRRDGAW